jgi:hypothetical protein
MERLTYLNDKIYSIKKESVNINENEVSGIAINRLAAFENLYFDLIKQQNEITAELEKLKAEDKQKTVKYRELFGKKLVNQNLIFIFEYYNFK